MIVWIALGYHSLRQLQGLFDFASRCGKLRVNNQSESPASVGL